MFESKGKAVATDEGAEHASAEDTAHDGGHQRFTDHGPKPAVAPMREEPAGASASDLAFGSHGRINTSPGVNVRTSPEKADNIVGGLANGAAVVVEAREGEWMKIKYGNARAFVFGAFVELTAKPHAPPAHPQPEVATVPEPVTTKHEATQKVDSADHAHAPETHQAAPATGEHAAAAPAPHADVTTPAAAPHDAVGNHPGVETFETIQHTQVEIHREGEGKVLSDIRAFKQQFDPNWLLQIQQKLEIGDATGAFNTETLRALRARFGEKLDGAKITSHAFLLQVGTKLGVEGEPFRAEVDGAGHAEADHTKTDPADIAAQSIGYADYDTYFATLKKTTFLGVSLEQGSSDGRAHPLLRSRIAAAEAYLVQRFGSQEKAIIGTGWSKKAGAAYATDSAAHDAKDPKSHMHTMGLAIDIDPNVNPYTMPKGDGLAADWIFWFYTTGFELGHRLGFGGDALNLDSLLKEGQDMSSEELHGHMLASSKSFARTVELSEKSDEEIKAALLAASPAYKDDSSETGIPHLIDKWFHPAKKIFHDAKTGERKFHETMTESKELLVALRDAGGLNWGGTEMSQGQNGDFMHFDMRNDSMGHKVYKAGYDAQQDRKARLAREAKEAARKAKQDDKKK